MEVPARPNDSAALGRAIASAVINAIGDACAERDCHESQPGSHCPCTLTFNDSIGYTDPHAGPLAVPCADPECDFIAYG